MDSISNIVADIVSKAGGKSGEQVTEELTAAGVVAPLKVVATGNVEKRRAPDCPNAYEVREEYKVDHGDGTFSDPWWGPWECL